jgi:hypothetical protein
MIYSKSDSCMAIPVRKDAYGYGASSIISGRSIQDEKDDCTGTVCHAAEQIGEAMK